MDALVTDPIAQWLAGIFGAVAGEIVKAAAKDGKEAFAKWLDGARGEEVKALQTALALALNDLERYEPQGERFVAFLEQRQKENDTLLGDTLLRALLIEPHGVLSLTPNLQTRIPLDLQPLALKFLSLFHQKLWSQSPFDKLLAAKAAQDELHVVLETLEILRRIEKKIGQTGGGVSLSDNAHLEVEGDFITHDQIIQGHKINVAPGGHLTIGGAPASLTPEELAAARRAYLEFIIGANQDVKPPSVIDAQNRVTLQLDEIYIPVTITIKKTQEEKDKKDKQDKSQEEPPKRIELTQIVQDYSRAALLGEPGAGKTTILRYLALHFAKTWQEHPEHSERVRDKEGNDYGAARVPIFVRLANYAVDKRDLREYILDAFGNTGASKEAIGQVLAEALSQGNALVLLDGLDEVIDNRSDVIEQIESFDAGLAKGNQVIVTSRKSGYGRALGGAFKAFVLNDLERDQIDNFLVYWNLAIEKKLSQEKGETFQSADEYEQAVKTRAQARFADIAEKLDTNVGAQNLAKNPLTLRMLAEAYRWSGDLPNRRVDLYNLIVKQSLEFWETQVAHIPKGRNVSRKEAITRLAPLAYWMHSENQSPSEDQIADRLGEILASKLNLKPDHPDVESAVDDFWTRVKERTGLFVQDTPNHYRFVHDTFREFFAGLYLVQDRAQAAQRIYAHRHQPRWEEPILLGIAHASTDDSKFASDLIRTAILAEGKETTRLGFESSRYEDVLHRDLLFAVKCVRDCVGLDEDLLEHLFGALATIYSDSDENGKLPIHERIDSVLRSLRGSEASRVAQQFSLKTEIDEEFIYQETLHGHFWVLKEWGVGEQTIKSILLRALKNQEPEIRRLAVSSFSQFPNLTHDDIAALIMMVNDEDTNEIAVRNLIRISNLPADVAVELTNIALEQRGVGSYEAGDQLKNLKGERPEVIAILIAALQSGDPDLQIRAVYVTEQFGRATSELVSSLLTLLQQKQWLQTQLERWIQSLDYPDIQTKSQMGDDVLNMLEDTTREQISIAEIKDILSKRGYSDTNVNHLSSSMHGWIAAHNSLRRGVVTTLGKMAYSTPEVINALVTELQRPTLDDFSRLRIAESLAFLGNAGDELVECLTNIYEKIPPKPHSWEREHAIELLGQLKHNNLKAIATLTAALNDENADVQLKAARGLGNLPQMDREVVSALVDRIGDKRIDVHWAKEFPPAVRERSDLRWVIARSLGKLASKEPEILAELSELNDPAQELWEQFWSGFAEGNTPIFTSMLLRLLNNPNSEIGARRVSASRLHGLRQVTPEIVHSLATALQDDDVELRQSAIGSLKYLSDSESSYNTFFLEPLKFTTPAVIEAVLKASNDEDANVRSDAVYLLGRLENEVPNISSLVIKAMDDPVIEVRQAASSVLGRLRTITPKAIMTFLNHLNDEDEEVRSNSARGLAELSYEERHWIGFSTSEGIAVGNTLRVSLGATSEPEIYGSLWEALWAVAGTLSTPNPKTTNV